MNAVELFNRWLRSRRNPIYGILYLGIIYLITQQRGWSLVGYIAFFIIVIFPVILVSDNHMGHIRNFEDDVVPGISLLTLGISGVITQYTTRDGSIPLQKSLANLSTFFSSLLDK